MAFNTEPSEAFNYDFERTEAVKFKFKNQKRDLSLRALRKQLRKYDLKWRMRIKRNTTVIIDLNDPEDFEIEVKHKF
jgi:hypothetical protein